MSAGETKSSSQESFMDNASTIAQSVKRDTDGTRNIVVPPYLIAGFSGDRSGSMCHIELASGKGLYKWLEETVGNAYQHGQNGRIFVTTFDDKTEKIIEGELIKDVKAKVDDGTYDSQFCCTAMKARGSTKLYDTAMEDLDRIVEARDNLFDSLPANIKNLNPDIAMIWACCTDGFDNKSVHTRKEFREKVLWARNKGVKCFFLAANQDAQVVGAEYGFNPDTSLTFGADVERTECALRSVTQVMREVSCGNSDSVFTQLMRETSAPPTFTPSTSPNTYGMQYMQGIPQLSRGRIQRQVAWPPTVPAIPMSNSPPVSPSNNDANGASGAAMVAMAGANITPTFVAEIGRS